MRTSPSAGSGFRARRPVGANRRRETIGACFASRPLGPRAASSRVFGVRTALTGGTRGEYAYGFRVWIDSLLLPLIIFAVVRRVVAAKEGAAERIALSLMIAGLLLAVIGIGETIFGFQLASSIRGGSVFFDTSINQVRISGPYESPAPYGLALVLCLAATLYWILMRPRAPDTLLLALGVAALQFTAIFLNFFRVGWISAILVIVCSIGLRRGRALRLLVVVGTVALVGALVCDTAAEPLCDLHSGRQQSEHLRPPGGVRAGVRDL